MPRLRFKAKEGVKIIGKDSPFVGEKGTFLEYENLGREITKVIVKLDSTRSMHWFFRDEVWSHRAG